MGLVASNIGITIGHTIIAMPWSPLARDIDRQQTRLRIPAAQFARALPGHSTLLSQEGAGKAGC
jgi:hypothetical protein